MKYVKITVFIFVCVCLTICVCSVINLHQKYPNPIEHFYSVGETFTFESYEIKVLTTKRWNLNSFCEEYHINNYLVNYTDEQNICMCLVSLEIKNITSKPVTPELYQIYLGDPTGTTGLDLFFFQDMNGGSTEALKPTIEPNETIIVNLPYAVYGSNFGYDKGVFLDKLDLELTFSLYPQKHVVKLNREVKDEQK